MRDVKGAMGYLLSGVVKAGVVGIGKAASVDERDGGCRREVQVGGACQAAGAVEEAFQMQVARFWAMRHGCCATIQ